MSHNHQKKIAAIFSNHTGFSSYYFEDCTTARTTVIIDPVMGDYGRPYATYTPELCGR